MQICFHKQTNIHINKQTCHVHFEYFNKCPNAPNSLKHIFAQKSNSVRRALMDAWSFRQYQTFLYF